MLELTPNKYFVGDVQIICVPFNDTIKFFIIQIIILFLLKVYLYLFSYLENKKINLNFEKMFRTKFKTECDVPISNIIKKKRFLNF